MIPTLENIFSNTWMSIYLNNGQIWSYYFIFNCFLKKFFFYIGNANNCFRKFIMTSNIFPLIHIFSSIWAIFLNIIDHYIIPHTILTNWLQYWMINTQLKQQLPSVVMYSSLSGPQYLYVIGKPFQKREEKLLYINNLFRSYLSIFIRKYKWNCVYIC